MRYRLVAVGRVRDAALRAACEGYLRRLRRYARVGVLEVKDDARLVAAIPAGARVIALSRQGDACTSRELARWTADWDMAGRDVALTIGGAEGLPPGMLARADRVWSLSSLTLPHELARVVVLEQLYRAFSIRRGEPYHRGA
jgi:23S rRNA (pseudouridine1915-N3)-methyltransferase